MAILSPFNEIVDSTAPGERKEWYLQPKFLFTMLTITNLLLYVDRGIVPGATNEFNSFIKGSIDTDTPSVFLGLLQSAFIVGLAIGSAVFGHLVHFHGRFYLTGMGCSIWMLAVILSGLAKYSESYVLVLARMLSGVGEASLQVIILVRRSFSMVYMSLEMTLQIRIDLMLPNYGL